MAEYNANDTVLDVGTPKAAAAARGTTTSEVVETYKRIEAHTYPKHAGQEGKHKLKGSDILFYILDYAFYILFTLLCFFPFY